MFTRVCTVGSWSGYVGRGKEGFLVSMVNEVVPADLGLGPSKRS